jgi:hypothetical protein
MLALTRPHRQVFATLALLLFTVAPTVYIGHQVWRAGRPEHVREIETKLSNLVGLKVAIESVRHPRPGEDVLFGVSIRSEGDAKLVALACADVARVHREGSDLTIETQGLRISTTAPGHLPTEAAALLAKLESASYGAISFAADGCELSLGTEMKYQLRALAGRVAPAGDGSTTLSASYQVPSDGSPTRCELTLTRIHADGAPRIALAFRTMEGPPLPAKVLDPFFTASDWLGAAARVEGSLALRRAANSDWEANFEGNLYDVDLAALTDHQFPDHRLRGLARVKVDAAHWGELPGGKQGFGWIDSRGSLTAGQGSISSSLVLALAQNLKFRAPRRPDSSASDLEFHNLGLKFALHRNGEIRFEGDLGPEFAPGAVLARGDRTAPLVMAPDGAASVIGLRKALVPVASSDQLVPARPESEFLRHLPLPTTGVAAALKAN